MNTLEFLMRNNPTFLAIIPARGGSKRLPNKNILDFNGQPLISYTIQAALKSKYITKTIVSSDNDTILEIAKQYGSEILKRPGEFASDTATSFEVIQHTLSQESTSYDYIILLQPTSPLREAKHIDEAISLLMDKNADAVISTCEVDHPIQWNMPLNEDLDLSTFVKNIDTRRSQEQQKHYRLNGAIYITKQEKLLEKESFFLEKNIYAYIMDKKSSIDIDDLFDFKIAKLFHSEL